MTANAPQQQQIDTIAHKPTIYHFRNYNKPNYNDPHVSCDVCGLQNLDYYVSNPNCLNFDLCYMCFNRASTAQPVISNPFNIVPPSSSVVWQPFNPGAMSFNQTAKSFNESAALDQEYDQVRGLTAPKLTQFNDKLL